VSPAGTDLYFSIVTRPSVEPRSTPLITLATGLGVRDAVAELLPERAVQVKWPNDIWVGGRKCAGILVESRVVGNKLEAIILGVGLNVNRTEWPVELEGLATSLRLEREQQEALERAEVFRALLFHIERWVTRFVRDGAPSLLSALRPHLALVGAPIRWEDGRGVFEGIDEHGAALARSDAGVVALHAARIERDTTAG
jgi:BirA family biotin operon repressor/biotin-[acetyl-CoA-carboxylase] ligase